MDVVVVGGGVAGTVSGIALRRLGARVRLYEAYPDPGGDVGSYLSLAANGLRALGEIDSLERVRGRGFPVARQLMWTGSGSLLGDVPRARLATDNLHSVTLMRAHLVRELRQTAVDAGVEVVAGERMVSAGPTGGLATGRAGATFASGLTVEADLLVGADGIWSVARSLVNPGLRAPTFAGQYTISGVSGGVEVEQGTFNLAFCRNGAFLWVRTPTGEVWWQAQVTSEREPARTDVPDEEWLRRLRRLYRHDPVPAGIIAAATGLHPVIVNHILPEVPVWHHDRIVLVGDAAHPVGAGQGASMAIEGALALAGALGTSGALSDPGCLPAALSAYQAVRRPRVARVLMMAGENRHVKRSGLVKRRVERLFMPYFFRTRYEKSTAWLFGEQPPALAGTEQSGSA